MIAMLLQVACKKSVDLDPFLGDSTANIIETLVGELNAQNNELSTAVRRSQTITNKSLKSSSICHLSSARSTCISGSSTITWNCTIGSTGALLTGVITELYGGPGSVSCVLGGGSAAANRIISSVAPRTITFATGAQIISSMDLPTAWDGTTFPSASFGTGIVEYDSGSINSFSCSSGNPCYQFNYNGIKTWGLTSQGRKVFEHIFQGTAYSQGKRSSSNLVVDGNITVWHQLLQYKATNIISGLAWGNSNCCYPTSGTITTTLTGSKTGSLSTTFTTTCGEANFQNENGVTSTLQMTQCTL